MRLDGTAIKTTQQECRGDLQYAQTIISLGMTNSHVRFVSVKTASTLTPPQAELKMTMADRC